MTNEQRLSRSGVLIALLIASIAASFVAFHFAERFPFDDTFISFRYAEHLAGGDGLVWNIGGPHTEGYTNFLFIVALAGMKLLGVPLLAGAQWMSLAFTVGIVLLCAKSAEIVISGDESTAGSRALIAGMLVLATPLVWINALSGMETSMFAFFVMLAIYLHLKGLTTVSYCAVFFAALTRPEGVILAPLLFATTPRTESRSAFRSMLTAFLLPGLLYLGWKFYYFGALLPNSFFVKVLRESGGAHSVFHGLQYVRLFTTSIGVILIASILAIRTLRNKLMTLWLWPVLMLTFYAMVTPLEGVYDRFLIPVVPALAVAAVAALSAMLGADRRKWLLPAGLSLLLVHVALVMESPRTIQSLAAHEEILNKRTQRIAAILKSLPNAQGQVLAFSDAGMVVYYTGMNHIDLFGLNTTAIARAHDSSEVGKYLHHEAPDIVLLPIVSDGASAGRCRLLEHAFGLVNDSGMYHAHVALRHFPYDLAVFLRESNPNHAAMDSMLTRLSLEHPEDAHTLSLR